MKNRESLQEKIKEFSDKLLRAKIIKEQAMKELKESFDVDTIEEAEALEAKLTKRFQKQEKAFTDALEQFEETYGDLFD